ncbi:hypothetical protein [Ruminiclostridium sufflavum]|nr:hypothetical protein [Ruminiclostridium sufflavum]
MNKKADEVPKTLMSESLIINLIYSTAKIPNEWAGLKERGG